MGQPHCHVLLGAGRPRLQARAAFPNSKMGGYFAKRVQHLVHIPGRTLKEEMWARGGGIQICSGKPKVVEIVSLVREEVHIGNVA